MSNQWSMVQKKTVKWNKRGSKEAALQWTWTRDTRRRVGNRRRHCADAQCVATPPRTLQHADPAALSHACAQVSGVALDATPKFVAYIHSALSIRSTIDALIGQFITPKSKISYVNVIRLICNRLYSVNLLAE